MYYIMGSLLRLDCGQTRVYLPSLIADPHKLTCGCCRRKCSSTYQRFLWCENRLSYAPLMRTTNWTELGHNESRYKLPTNPTAPSLQCTHTDTHDRPFTYMQINSFLHWFDVGFCSFFCSLVNKRPCDCSKWRSSGLESTIRVITKLGHAMCVIKWWKLYHFHFVCMCVLPSADRDARQYDSLTGGDLLSSWLMTQDASICPWHWRGFITIKF